MDLRGQAGARMRLCRVRFARLEAGARCGRRRDPRPCRPDARSRAHGPHQGAGRRGPADRRHGVRALAAQEGRPVQRGQRLQPVDVRDHRTRRRGHVRLAAGDEGPPPVLAHQRRLCQPPRGRGGGADPAGDDQALPDRGDPRPGRPRRRHPRGRHLAGGLRQRQEARQRSRRGPDRRRRALRDDGQPGRSLRRLHRGQGPRGEVAPRRRRPPGQAGRGC